MKLMRVREGEAAVLLPGGCGGHLRSACAWPTPAETGAGYLYAEADAPVTVKEPA